MFRGEISLSRAVHTALHLSAFTSVTRPIISGVLRGFHIEGALAGGGGSLGPPSTVRGHGTERVSKFTIDVECILTG